MRRKLLAAAAVVLSWCAVFAVPVAANATTEKCKGNFCAYVVGKGRNVERVKFSLEVHYHDYFNGYFVLESVNGPHYRLKTKTYYWHATHDDRFALGQTFYTGHYYLRHTFPNNTRLKIYSYDPLSPRYRTTITSITVHS